MTPAVLLDPSDSMAEIHGLIETLRATDQRLEELLGGEVDSVTDRSGEVMLLRRAQAHLRHSETVKQATILSALPATIALLDSRGVIVSVNAAWQQFADANALRTDRHGIGSSYLDACDNATGEDRPQAARMAAGIRSVLAGAAPRFVAEYACHSPTEQRWFCLTVAPIADGPQHGAVVMHTDMTAPHRAAAELTRLAARTQRRERILNTSLSSITDCISIFDRECRVMFANQPLLSVWGITLEDALGRTLPELGYPAEVAGRFDVQIQGVFRTGKRLEDEITEHGPQRVPGFFEHIVSPALAADGSVDFVVAVIRDITVRRRSELALKESFAQFRTLATAMPQIVWAAAEDGQPTYLNDRWMEYTGLSLADGLGEGWTRCLHPQVRQEALLRWRATARTSGTHSLEALLRRADGEYRWWLVRMVSVADGGDGLKWIGACTDIHDLKLAELENVRANRELQQQRTELRVLIDATPALIWFKDTHNNVLRANVRAARHAGLTVDQMEGQSVCALYPEEAQALYAADLEVIRSGRPTLGEVTSVTDHDGRQTWFERDRVPYHDESGKVIGILELGRDVTDRKRDQDALKELNASLEVRVRDRTAQLNLARDESEGANRAKSNFLATMSHEIRTPMGGLLGLLELLSLSRLDGEQQSTLTVARASGLALLHIIDDILDFSKIEANRLELNLVAASIVDVVNNACRLHSQIASTRNINLRATVSPEISHSLSVDPLRLGQILNNFLNNAIKFTEHGSVELLVDLVGRSHDTEQLRFTVRDTGIGMSAEQLGRLFQPFVQATSDTSARFGGTGLGLVISRRLAQLMGGTIGIESEQGRGTTLTLMVTFEICKPGGSPRDPNPIGAEALGKLMAGRRPAPTSAQAEADRTLVLVVDDHPTNRMVLLGQLASLGYAAEAVNDGIQALEAWRSSRFAALITDCNMPGMNGYALTRAIRSLEQEDSGRIPIIAYTANALPEATEFCIAAGMDDCLIKPAHMAEVAGKMERWLPVGASRGDAPGAGPFNVRPVARVSHGLLDLDLLTEVSGDNPGAQAALLLEFRRVNDMDAAVLRGAVGGRDFGAVLAVAHRIKGGSLMLGATLLAEVCKSVEVAGAASDGAALAAAIESFETELLRLNNYLDNFVSTEQRTA